MRARMPDDHPMDWTAPGELLDPVVARAAQTLRAEVPVRGEWRDHLLADLERDVGDRAANGSSGARGRAPRSAAWTERRRRLVLPWPVAAIAAAALFVAGLLTARDRVEGSAATGTRSPSPVAAVSTAGRRAATPTHFVLVAPDARRVALVGDFNLWNPSAAPMRRVGDGGLWELDVDLPAGRHVYAFVVDGDITADPAAPRTAGDDFGRPNSVVLVNHSHT
jgi:AMP-activated protein kinase-like protein